MIPPDYTPAAVRYVSRKCDATGDIAVSLALPNGTVARYRLQPKDVAFLQQGLALYAGRCACQSSSSSGMPSSDGSPHDGQNVSPPANSIAASAGCVYAPKSSPSNMACQQPSGSSRIQNAPARVLWLKAVNLFMALAFPWGGGWKSHSRKVSSAAQRPQE